MQLSDSGNAARRRDLSEAFISSATKQQNNEVHGSGFASFLGFGGSASADVNRNWSRSDYVNRRREDFAHNLEEMSARLSGDNPVVTGIQFTDAGTVLNVHVRNLEQSIGQFTTGLADYPAVRSLKEDADRQSQAQKVEALLVPQVLVGTTPKVGNAGWEMAGPNTWWRFKELVPGRSYYVEASTDLAQWSPVGSITATDFLVNFELADTANWPHRFFRIQTP